jgi:hypothetical protein
MPAAKKTNFLAFAPLSTSWFVAAEEWLPRG